MPVKHDDVLDKFEEDIRRLKNRYDQFFAGMQKMPPMTDRRQLEALIHELSKLNMHDNARRFRFNQLQSRYNQLREMWGRRMREREEGPLEFKRRQRALTTEPGERETPRAAAPRVTSGDSGAYVKVAGGTNGDDIKRLFDQIQSEQAKLGKSPNLTFEQLSAMVLKQTEMVRERYNVNAVAFRVETVDGKVKLKAKPVQE